MARVISRPSAAVTFNSRTSPRLTGIGFWTFVGISWLCMLPGTAAYTLAGSAIATGRGQPRTTIAYIAAAGVLLVALSLLPRWLGRRGRLAADLTGPTPGGGASSGGV